MAAFEEALRLDPATPWRTRGSRWRARRCTALRVRGGGCRPGASVRCGRPSAPQALDADLAETHQALADVYGKTEFEWDRVIKESHRALELNPRLDLPHAYLARAFYHLGLLERAGEEARAALDLEPGSADAVRALGITHFLSGPFREAVPLLEEVQRLSGKPLSDYYLALAYYYSGDTRRGEAVLEELTRASRFKRPAGAVVAGRVPGGAGRAGRAGELVGPGRGRQVHGPSRGRRPGRRPRPAGGAAEALGWLRRRPTPASRATPGTQRIRC